MNFAGGAEMGDGSRWVEYWARDEWCVSPSVDETLGGFCTGAIPNSGRFRTRKIRVEYWARDEWCVSPRRTCLAAVSSQLILSGCTYEA